MNVKERLNAFLNRLYIPKRNKDSFEKLKEFIAKVSIRAPNANDAHKSRYTILIIETKGKGTRETFDSWFVRFVDFDTIGEKYALAYIYDSEGNGKPHRIDITSSKNILID